MRLQRRRGTPADCDCMVVGGGCCLGVCVWKGLGAHMVLGVCTSHLLNSCSPPLPSCSLPPSLSASTCHVTIPPILHLYLAPDPLYRYRHGESRANTHVRRCSQYRARCQARCVVYVCVCVCVVCVARVKRGLDWRCIPPPSPAHHSLLSLPPSNPLRSPSARTRLVRFAVVVHHLLLIDFLPPRLVCSCILMTGSAWSPPAW